MVSEYTKALDFIIKKIYDQPGHAIYTQNYNTIPIIHWLALQQEFERKFKLPDRQFRLLIMKLRDDQMMVDQEKKDNTPCYYLTFKGIDWHKSGGYSKERRNQNLKIFYKWMVNIFLIIGSIATALIAYHEITYKPKKAPVENNNTY